VTSPDPASKRTLQFGSLLYGSGGHLAGWRHPSSPAGAQLDIHEYVRAARKLEEGGFAALFIADVVAIWGHQLDSLSRTARSDFFEPLTLLSALAPVTSKIGLVATATTSYNEPYNLARKFASLDHISDGRAGWNVVTSVVPLEATNFSRTEHFAHADRYRRAAEFVDIVEGLWDSYTDDALVRDKESGLYYRPEGQRAIEHRGEFFSVRGPLNISRPPQGHPVLFQAGASETGIEFAGRYGEVVFTAPVSANGLVEYRAKLDAEIAKAGRSPSQVKVWPLLTPIVAATDAEADEQLNELQSLLHDDVLRRVVQDNFGDEDFSSLDLDEPLPDFGESTNRSQSRRAGILQIAREKHLTLRELGLEVSRRGAVAGSAETVADHIEKWFATGAIDGFNISFPYLHEPLENFVDQVLPILTERGLFERRYGNSLRETLGLTRPDLTIDSRTGAA
jgi:FMN-dependent oxidoreductase (nitrilotriacetate monooxygenase family)